MSAPPNTTNRKSSAFVSPAKVSVPGDKGENREFGAASGVSVGVENSNGKGPSGPIIATVTNLAIDPEPRTRREALRRSDGLKWDTAMKEELASLEQNDTWHIVPRPTRQRVLTGRWVLKRKLNSLHQISRYKARFVVRGFKQVFGIDFDETYALVVKPPSYKLFFALAAYFG